MNETAAQVVSGALSTTRLSRDERLFLERWRPAGLTLFRRNFDELEQNTKTLTNEIQQLFPQASPCLISIDQEGGRVRRLRTSVDNPGAPLNIEDGATDSNALQKIEAGQARVGEQLYEQGIHINFAPVVDIWSPTTHEAIGDRCWGRSPQAVTARAQAALIGLRKSGVSTCLKHFPGQGLAQFDTHVNGASIDLSRAEMDEHLAPFLVLSSHADMIMISHAIYNAFGNIEACFNSFLLREVLRSQLGFQGIIVSDDLTMGALDQKERGEVAVRAIAAGCDLLLVCQGLDHWRSVCEAISNEASKSSAFAARLHDSADRVRRLRSKYQPRSR